MPTPALLPGQPPATAAPPLSQFMPGVPPVGGNISTGPGGVALTSVNPNELTSYQLGQLMRSDNPLVQEAAGNARNLAASRGSGMSGSQYAEAATEGVYNSLTPIANADAGRYGSVADENQTALNQRNITDMNNTTSLDVAGIGANASMHNSDNSLHEAKYEFDTQQKNRLQNRDWQLADQNTAARAAQRSQVFNQAIQTVFSDPSFWKDPQGSLGMINTYSSNIDALLQKLFPEYYATDQQGNSTAPPPQQQPLPTSTMHAGYH